MAPSGVLGMLNMVGGKQASILQTGTFYFKGYIGNHSMESDRS